jgi:serine protease
MLDQNSFNLCSGQGQNLIQISTQKTKRPIYFGLLLLGLLFLVLCALGLSAPAHAATAPKVMQAASAPKVMQAASAPKVMQAAPAATEPAAQVIVKFKTGTTRSVLSLNPGTAAAAAEPQLQPHLALRERAQALGQRAGVALQSGSAVGQGTQLVTARGLSSVQLAARLAKQADVEYAVVNQRRFIVQTRPAGTANDPLFQADLSGLGLTPVVGQWYLRAPAGEVQSAIDAPAAWAITQGHDDAVVAVIDTGVRFDHPDLKRVAQGGKLLPGYDMITDRDISNDGTARDNNPADPGDWVGASDGGLFPDLPPIGPVPPIGGSGCGESDSSWHGTQTASLIAAITNNGIGMAGTGPGLRVLPVRALGKCGGDDADIVAAMRWAAGLPVDGVPANPTPASVINMSLGAPGECNSLYRDTVNQIIAKGVVIVASAGNSAGHALGAPANCPGVIAVSGLRHVGTKVGFADLGPDVAISAPGGNCVNTQEGADCLYPIITATNSGKTKPQTSTYTNSRDTALGTSFSAPLVAATVGLMKSAQPSITPTQVRQVLLSTARPFPTSGVADVGGKPVPVCTAPRQDASGNPIDQEQCYCTTSTCGAGMLDAGGALQAVLSTVGVVANIEVTTATPKAGAPVSLRAAPVTDPGRTIASYQWALVDGGTIVTALDGDTQASSAQLTPSYGGRFKVRLKVVDDQGREFSTTQQVYVEGPASPNQPREGEIEPETNPRKDDNSPFPPRPDQLLDEGGGALGWSWLAFLAIAVLIGRKLERVRR